MSGLSKREPKKTKRELKKLFGVGVAGEPNYQGNRKTRRTAIDPKNSFGNPKGMGQKRVNKDNDLVLVSGGFGHCHNHKRNVIGPVKLAAN